MGSGSGAERARCALLHTLGRVQPAELGLRACLGQTQQSHVKRAAELVSDAAAAQFSPDSWTKVIRACEVM